MLSQFRTRYPKGSLTSELLAIEHGKYIVKVFVQVEGIILATGLAACETLERAEDTARERALITLNLDSTPIRVSDETPVVPAPEKNQSPAIALQSTEHLKIDSNLTQSTPESELFPSSQPSVNGNKKVDEPITPKDETTPDDSELLTPPPVSEPTPTSKEEQPSPDISDVPASSTGKTAKTPKNKNTQPKPVVEDIPTPSPEPETSLPLDPIPEDEIPSASEPLEETSPTSTPEQLDFSEIVVRSNAQLKRLGWTTEMGKDYLLKTYGKKSRHLLNDQELLEFLNYLESLPTPPSQE
ncbi:conserved hypothetical protein [Gloeothece citriformis PCC 7424]|uniref:Uncharacterized protein n=1 Tax=Gloeothece citriformis (strain PCC 7424) TaxID=65393 RepID=B7KFA2_GLOC7|nr:hypothetical protein [Gloeothece citriformis]ACK71818.1 conserved hypothetical protein [Gloeothece citriformis PCC 7424]